LDKKLFSRGQKAEIKGLLIEKKVHSVISKGVDMKPDKGNPSVSKAPQTGDFSFDRDSFSSLRGRRNRGRKKRLITGRKMTEDILVVLSS